MNVQLILLIGLIVLATIGWTAYLVLPELVNHFYGGAIVTAAPARHLVIVRPPALRHYLKPRIAQMRRVPRAGTPVPCEMGTPVPADEHDINTPPVDQQVLILVAEVLRVRDMTGEELRKLLTIRRAAALDLLKRARALNAQRDDEAAARDAEARLIAQLLEQAKTDAPLPMESVPA